MTPAQARGNQVLMRLLIDAMARMRREDAASFIDALKDGEIADAVDSASAAGVATGTGGNLFYESLARRVRAKEAPPRAFPHPLIHDELLERQGFTSGMVIGPVRSASTEQGRYVRVVGKVEACGPRGEPLPQPKNPRAARSKR